jgi:hypothetical protein
MERLFKDCTIVQVGEFEHYEARIWHHLESQVSSVSCKNGIKSTIFENTFSVCGHMHFIPGNSQQI